MAGSKIVCLDELCDFWNRKSNCLSSEASEIVSDRWNPRYKLIWMRLQWKHAILS